jgi:DNA mismatch endonuclease (patch repair protein)
MADNLSVAERSRLMARIRGKDTKPEMVVRRYLHAAGLRFRLHRRELPGRPDIVFPGRRAVVFVHGCFWHGCPACIDGQRRVKSNTQYWIDKVLYNQERDTRNRETLQALGWKVIVVWECETDDPGRLAAVVKQLGALPMRSRRTEAPV